MTRKRNIVITVLALLFLALFIVLFLFFRLRNERETTGIPPREGDRITIRELLGMEQEGSDTEDVDVEDLPTFEPSDESPDGPSELPDHRLPGSIVGSDEEDEPRLVRLFAGPAAGYKVNQLVNSFEVKVIEQGIPNRFVITTSPYNLEALGDASTVVKVLEAHLFDNDKILLLYESPENETVVRSVFENFDIRNNGAGTQQFENNIVATTDNKNSLFFLREINDHAVGLVVDVSDPSETEIIWESSFLSWIPRWGRNPYITLQTPLSPYATTRAYLVNPKNPERRTPVGFGTVGTSVFVDMESGFFVYYESDRSDLAVPGRTEITNQDRTAVFSFPLTLPEKCDGFNGVFVCAIPLQIPLTTLSGYRTMFPDSWYQGDIVFEDAILQIDTFTGKNKVLLDPNDPEIELLSNGQRFDIINLQISNDGKHIFFMDKTDLSIWMLRI